MQAANDATAAHVYTRQLYTAFGVGLSSLSVRRVMLPTVMMSDWEINELEDSRKTQERGRGSVLTSQRDSVGHS